VFCNDQGKPLHAANLLRRSFHPLLEKAGLPRLRFHDLRHSTASLLLAQNVHPKIVQELLGHSKISVTMDAYSHVLPTLQESAMQRFSMLFSPECSSPNPIYCPLCRQIVTDSGAPQ
jgi:integrase